MIQITENNERDRTMRPTQITQLCEGEHQKFVSAIALILGRSAEDKTMATSSLRCLVQNYWQVSNDYCI